jgi:hypothetical protein
MTRFLINILRSKFQNASAAALDTKQVLAWELMAGNVRDYAHQAAHPLLSARFI